MKYDFWGLLKHLKHPLKSVYVLHGDETLLQQEALIALRQAANKQGFSERERHDIDRGHDWAMAFADSNALSLFSDKKLIEIHGNKPDAAGGKVLEEYLKNPPEDNVVILVLPKLEAAAFKSKWFTACEDNGVTVSCAPLTPVQLKDWLMQRFSKANITLDPDALAWLCEQTEGNLLAANQEVTKLSLLYGEKNLTLNHIQKTIGDSARFDLFDLTEAAIAGNGTKTAKILFSLKAEGQAESLVLWALSRDIRTLCLLAEGVQLGNPLSQLFQQCGVWNKQQPVMQQALKRLPLKKLLTLNRELLAADKAIKGQSLDNAWDILLRISLALAGVTLFETVV